MLDVLFTSALAIAAGASIVIQQIVNANLREALKSTAWAGFASYLGGLLFMAALALSLRDALPPVNVLLRVPVWAWTGGVFGAIFIALSIVLVPQLGAATFIALFVTGQMLASLLFDHFGWLGLVQRALDPPRLIGAALLVAGVVLIRR